LRLKTKLTALAVAGSTAGFFGYTATTTAARACGSAQVTAPTWSEPAGPATVYASSSPTTPPSGAPSGYAGVAGSGGGFSGYAQATGTVGAPAPAGTGTVGNVVVSGSSPAGSGTIGVGNDANGTGGTAIGTTGYYVCS
jgi:hypothetical protein